MLRRLDRQSRRPRYIDFTPLRKLTPFT